MSSLIATLWAASGLVADFQATVGGGGVGSAGTAANLKDGSDSTGVNVQWIGDGVDADTGHYSEDWTVDSLAAPPAGTEYVIEKVTVILRGKKSNNVGTFTNNLLPRIASADRGTPASQTTSYANNSFDFTTDPADGQPWTRDKINAQKFGFKTTCESPSRLDNNSSAYVREMSVEVRGALVTTPSPVVVQASPGPEAMIYASEGAVVSCVMPAQERVLLGIMEGSASPESTSNAGLVLRATDPAVLGDGSTQYNASPAGGDPISALGTAPIRAVAAAIADPPAAYFDKTIEYIVIHVAGGNRYGNLAGTPFHAPEASRFVYSVGGLEATQETVANPFLGASTILDPVTNEVLPGYGLGFPVAKSDPIMTQPNGQPWTWDAISGLSNVGMEQNLVASAGHRRIAMRVTEVHVEVFVKPAAPPPFRKVPIKAPIFTPRPPAGINVDPKGANAGGVVRVPYNTGAFRPAGPGEPAYTQQGFVPTPFRKTPNPKP